MPSTSAESPLPEEVSLALLSFLDVPALARFSLVSRACHRLALDPALWKGLCEREMAAWPCHRAFIGLAAEALLAAHRRAAALGEWVDPGAGLWPQPFSWRAFFRCEALHPWPEGRFYLRQQLGGGSYGSRFKALERETERVVVIKWINIEEEQNSLEEGRQVVLVEDEAKRKKIFEEKEALAARLMPVTWRSKQLPNVFGLYWRPTTDTICLSRECAPRTLDEELEETNGQADEGRIADVVRDVLTGLVDLQTACGENVVAGINLDWNKLLVADDGHTMINIDQIFYPCANARPYYISPELMPGTTIDVEGECSSVNRTHIWAVGLIAIQLATGALPMEHMHPIRYLSRYDQLAPRGLDGPHSPELKDLVRLCLERQPQRRPSAHELLRHQFLADVRRGRASPTRPTN